MDEIFRKKEPSRGSGGWFNWLNQSGGGDGPYISGPPIEYDKPVTDAIPVIPVTYAITEFKAEGVRSPAWDLCGDSFDYRVEVIQAQSPVNMYSARSPAWDLCGD